MEAVPSGQALQIRQSDGWEAVPFPSEPIVLQPGETAQVEVGPGSWCGRPEQAPTTINLVLSPGLEVRVQGFGFGQCFENKSTLDVSGYGPVATPLPTPPPGLSASILAPATARAGEPLRYWVVIRNTSAESVSLDQCADFVQRLGATANTGLLPCGAIGSTLPAGASLALQMELEVPQSLSGHVPLFWQGLRLDAAKVDVLVTQ